MEDETASVAELSCFEVGFSHPEAGHGSVQRPTVLSVAPSQISSEGGDSVRLVGMALDAFPNDSTVYVEFGAGESALAERVTSNEIICVSPPLPRTYSFDSVGGYFVLVRVTNLADVWSNAVQVFVETPPKALSASPNTGPSCGGTTVAIIGEAFLPSPALACLFGEGDTTKTTPAMWHSPSLVECVTPSWSVLDEEGEVSVPFVLINNGNQRPRSLFWFRFVTPIVITRMSPSMGPAINGTIVAFHGFNFDRYDLACRIGGYEIPAAVHGSNRLQCRVPPRISPSGRKFQLTVVTEYGSDGIANGFVRYELLGSDMTVNSTRTLNATDEISPVREENTVVLPLVRGYQYWIDQTHESNDGYPIALSSIAGGSHVPGGVSWASGVERFPSLSNQFAHGGVEAISTGAGVLSFLVPLDAPDVLYLYSEDSAMVRNTIKANITDDVVHTSVMVVAPQGSVCDSTEYPFRCVTVVPDNNLRH